MSLIAKRRQRSTCIARRQAQGSLRQRLPGETGCTDERVGSNRLTPNSTPSRIRDAAAAAAIPIIMPIATGPSSGEGSCSARRGRRRPASSGCRFTESAADDIRDHAVDADRRQQQGQQAERTRRLATSRETVRQNSRFSREGSPARPERDRSAAPTRVSLARSQRTSPYFAPATEPPASAASQGDTCSSTPSAPRADLRVAGDAMISNGAS